MKVQCQCGAKFAFDVTPEMARDPVRFICQGCGLDLSGPINDLIRQELGLAQTAAPVHAPQPAPAAVAPAPMRVAAPALVAAAAPAVPAGPARLSIGRSASAATHGTATQAAPQPGAGDSEGQPCPKHKGEVVVEKCRVCQKPLCPKCMEIFGYVCSPLCKARAESHGINVPVFAGQKSVVEAQQWRKIGLIGAGIGAVVVGLLGVWFWYAWFGSVPHPIFSARFPEMSYAGSSQLCGKNQIVFLHGGLLARYDISSKKPVWTTELITKQQLDDELTRRQKEIEAEMAEAIKTGSDYRPRARPAAEVAQEIQEQIELSVQLFASGQNVWVARNGKLTRYDWETGKPGQEIAMPEGYRRPKVEGDSLLFTQENAFGQHIITHLSLASGETNTEEIGEPVKSAVLAQTKKPSLGGKKGTEMAGLPTDPSADPDKPLDPKTVAAQAQSLPYANRVALPATLSSAMHQQQISKEIKEDEALGDKMSFGGSMRDLFGRDFINSKYGYVEWSSKMLEERYESHSAMKAPPAKSALEGNVTAAKTTEVANEILNEMQRNRGGDVETEDVSRYQVTVHRPDAKDVPDWVGEVIGPPSIIQQKTVTVVKGGQMIVVLDKSNKKLWQADLSHKFSGGSGFEDSDPGEPSIGEGPCVENGDALYVFDEATLTAFDLATGNVRWRVPSIGIAGMFFDDQGTVYVNSTTANLESIKYSRQIDISKKTSASVLRIECKTGKVLWNVEPGGFISHVEGKVCPLFCLVRCAGFGSGQPHHHAEPTAFRDGDAAVESEERQKDVGLRPAARAALCAFPRQRNRTRLSKGSAGLEVSFVLTHFD